MNIEILEQIGLTKSEIKVYLALLELGSSATGKIVDKSKVASSKVYEILDKLIQKGLVSFIIISGIKHFEAASPARIMDYMEERERLFNKQKQELKKILPELELKQKLSKYKSEATIFKGLKGAKTAYDDVLKTMKKGEEYYVMGATEPTRSFSRFIWQYHKKRAKKGIKLKIIFSKHGRALAEKYKSLAHTQIKFAPTQLLTSSFILVYKHKILIVVATRKEVTIFRINDEEIADSFKSQFKLLWNQDTRIVRGLDAIQDLFDEILESKNADFIGARGYFVDKRKKYMDEWEKRAIKKGLKFRNIVDPEIKGHRITKFPFGKTKYILPKEFSKLSVFWIFNNKVAISNWTKKEPIVIIIENKQLYDMYKQQFELLWKKDKF